MQCNPYNGCPGSAGNCEPRFVWSGTVNSGTNYYAGYLNNGGFGNSNYTYAYAFGVRCVLDLKSIQTGCPGSNNGNCNPYLVWTSTLSSGTSYYRGNLNSGSFTLNSGDYTRAYSVRCVLDLRPADNCYPNYVWSGTESGGKYHDYYLNQGTFKTLLETGTYAYSVRCVLDLKSATDNQWLPGCGL